MPVPGLKQRLRPGDFLLDRRIWSDLAQIRSHANRRFGRDFDDGPQSDEIRTTGSPSEVSGIPS